MKHLCPHKETFIFDDEEFSASQIIKILTPYLTDKRRQKIKRIISNRTYAVTPVMEGLYDRGNVAAVMRSAEAMGYQEIHIIETSKKFKQAKRVTQGADKWLDIHRWESTLECLKHLKGQGRRILATHLGNAKPIDEFSFKEPTALVFGNEKDGVSDEILELADDHVMMPMLGFTQSFNISVAAALCLFHIYKSRQQDLPEHGDLTSKEKRILSAKYYIRSTTNAKRLLLHARQT